MQTKIPARRESPWSAREGIGEIRAETPHTAQIELSQAGGITKKLQNLEEHICSFENLFCSFQAAAEGKYDRPEVLRFMWNLEENLLSIQHDLRNRTYTVGRYREFVVRYPKARLVMALDFRDRVVQWAIYRQINPFIEKRFINHSYGCRENKGTLRAAQCLLNWQRKISRKADANEWYIIKGDVAKYFYRVNHEKALAMYADICDEPWFLWLMGTIINNPDVPFGLPEGASIDSCPRDQRLYDVGMPIGNLTSQATANIYLDRLDQFCKHQLHLRYYIRYMDDFIIFVKGRKAANEILTTIGDFLKSELALDLSTKSRIIPVQHQVEFVGYAITPHGMRLRKKTTRHIKRSLKRIAYLYAQGRISYRKSMQTIACYFGMTKHSNGHNLRRWISNNIILSRQTT